MYICVLFIYVYFTGEFKHIYIKMDKILRIEYKKGNFTGGFEFLKNSLTKIWKG